MIMTVEKLAEALNWKAISLSEPDREITGGYCGDLLSWVMGRAESGDCWFTIMSNINVVAVAHLTDVACVVFTEGVMPEASVIERAKTNAINLVGCEEPTYTASVKAAELLK